MLRLLRLHVRPLVVKGRKLMDVLASLEGVRKRFGAVAALDGLNLEVRRGELLALLGPNGAGKTTAICAHAGPAATG